MLNFLLWVNGLDLFDSLSLDLMNMIELTKKCLIDSMVAKMPMEQHNSLIQRFASPFIENLWILKKINMLLL